MVDGAPLFWRHHKKDVHVPATVLLVTAMSWPFPAQLAGAFAGAGAQVEALAPAGSMLARSCHPRRQHLYSSLAPMDCLTQAIAAAKPDMIVPCDDLAARLVAQVQNDPLPGRLDFLRRAAEAGAPDRRQRRRSRAKTIWKRRSDGWACRWCSSSTIAGAAKA